MAVPTITVNGRLGRDPQSGTSQSGRTYVRVFVISSSRRLNRQTNQWEDGDSFAIGGVAFDDPQRGTTFATNIAQSLHKGDAVIMTGRIRENRNPNAPEGTPPSVEMMIDDIAPSLRYATAQVIRNQRGDGQGGGYQGGYNGGQGGSGYNGGNSGYQGGNGYNGGYSGGANYQSAPAAPAQRPAAAAPAPSQPQQSAESVWGDSANSGGFGAYGSSFGGDSENSDFGGGSSDDPAF